MTQQFQQQIQSMFVDSHSTISDHAYEKGYDGASEDDRSDKTFVTAEENGEHANNVLEQSQKCCGARRRAYFSPPLYYPQEWDSHLPSCECDICGVSVRPVRTI